MGKTILPGSGLTVTTPGEAGGPASRAKKKRAADRLGGKKKVADRLVGKSCGQAGWEKGCGQTGWKKSLLTDWLGKKTAADRQGGEQDC